MNIFILDEDIVLCARYHLDKHIVKMPLESAQMLSTAVLTHGGTARYKAAHKNHPCSIWARETKSNFQWLVSLGVELCQEYTFRYGKVHKCLEVINECLGCLEVIPSGPLTPFAQAMPEEYKKDNAVEAYRAYYAGAKSKIAAWKNREVPEWWNVRQEARHREHAN